MCFFPIAVSFSDGLAQVDEEYVHLVRSYGASRLSAYRLVKIPAATPALLSGLKVSATYSISGAVVGEWIGAQEGLGYYPVSYTHLIPHPGTKHAFTENGTCQ